MLNFKPSRFPFFYGWVVLVAGTAGMLMSAPGQTIGVSVFTDSLIEDLDVERSLLSLAYLIGTLASAAVLAPAGRLYDRFGARRVATAAVLGLAATLFALSHAAAFGGGFVVITVGFFLLRFTGQGVLTLASRNMVMEWFEKRRGLANAVLGVSISFGFSAAPRVFEALLDAQGWQGAWRLIAAALVGFALLALFFYRDTPEAHGMKPDGPGRIKVRVSHPETAPAQSFTPAEARRTYTFWVFALSLFLGALVMTAYTFHVVSIFEDAGMSRDLAVNVFLPASFVAVGVQFAGSWLSDRTKLKYIAAVGMLGQMTLCGALVFLAPGLPYGLVVVGHGLTQGIFGITANITWPRFFGRRHLGAISGFAMALTVAGSAIGPYAFSLARDLTGSYAAAALIGGGIAAVLFVALLRTSRPRRPHELTSSGNTTA